jgi:hypothetical protein
MHWLPEVSQINECANAEGLEFYLLCSTFFQECDYGAKQELGVILRLRCETRVGCNFISFSNCLPTLHSLPVVASVSTLMSAPPSVTCELSLIYIFICQLRRYSNVPFGSHCVWYIPLSLFISLHLFLCTSHSHCY